MKVSESAVNWIPRPLAFVLHQGFRPRLTVKLKDTACDATVPLIWFEARG